MARRPAPPPETTPLDAAEAAPADPNSPPPPVGFVTEMVALSDLRPHPRDYREHPEDQLEHIVASIKQHGFYRNVVVARDGTILAGHGVVLASQRAGLERVAVVRLPIEANSQAALKLLAGDNEISHLGSGNDRALTELLSEIKANDPFGLLGTGYDEKMLASLVFITRPAGEVKTLDEAAEWVGMPEFGAAPEEVKAAVVFRSKEDRLKWVAAQERAGFELKMHYKSEAVWSTWWPAKERDDLMSVRFEQQGEQAEA